MNYGSGKMHYQSHTGQSAATFNTGCYAGCKGQFNPFMGYTQDELSGADYIASLVIGF